MRQAIRSNPQRRPKAETLQIPFPVKGWTAQDSPVDAAPDTALILDNFFPVAEGGRVRRGFAPWGLGIGTGDVETLMAYTSATASKLFAAAEGSIYDASFEGSTPAASLTGHIESAWQHVMFATPAGQFLYAVNGADPAIYFDGTNWTSAAITGVDSSALINVIAHKSRLWFAQVGSTSLWYLPVLSIAGEAVEFPIGSLLTHGGYIMAMGIYSYDAGTGMDDLLFAWSSEGEVIVYQGTDPDSVITWGLVGVFRIGKPVGRRCIRQIAGDSALISEDGIMPFSKIMKLDRSVVSREALTAPIRQAFSTAVQRARDVFGWQMVVHPIRNMAVVNVPASGSAEVSQFVINTTTGAWCRFIGMNAVCWGTFDNQLFFGGTDGVVYKADYGGSDNNVPISAAVLPAYNHLGGSGGLKHVKLCQPIFTSDTPNASPAVSIATDYELPEGGSSTDPIDGNFFTWDISYWDGPDIWFGFQYRHDWTGSGGIGTVVSPYTTITVDTVTGTTVFTWDTSFWDGPDTWSVFLADFQVQITGWGIVYERGGIL